MTNNDDPKSKVSLIVANRELWRMIKERYDRLIAASNRDTIRSSDFWMAVMAIQTILSEYTINKEEYEKYEKVESCEDYIFKEILENQQFFLQNPSPEAEHKYIESARKIVWGYINVYVQDMAKLLLKISKKSTGKKQKDSAYFCKNLSKKDKKLLQMCVLSVTVECIIRDKERKSLEKQYE